MRTQLTLAFLALVAWVGAAQAANTDHYPATVMDDACTDSYTTPVHAPAAEMAIKPAPQTGGTADGWCDHDSRIKKAAATADTTFGPFALPPGAHGIIVFVDANTVSNDTDTWSIDLSMQKPDDQTLVVMDTTGSVATEGDKQYGFLPALAGADSGAATADVDVFVPRLFYLTLNLGTATSWAGVISWVAF